MSKIKFRAYDKESKAMEIFGLPHNSEIFYKYDLNTDLMQFIGLTDRGGQEIFEGDYLQDTRGFQYEVKRVGGGFAINTFADEFNKKWTLWTGTSDMQTSGFIQDNCEVIGNKIEGIK